jgi:hypothetical protein
MTEVPLTNDPGMHESNLVSSPSKYATKTQFKAMVKRVSNILESELQHDSVNCVGSHSSPFR